MLLYIFLISEYIEAIEQLQVTAFNTLMPAYGELNGSKSLSLTNSAAINNFSLLSLFNTVNDFQKFNKDNATNWLDKFINGSPETPLPFETLTPLPAVIVL